MIHTDTVVRRVPFYYGYVVWAVATVGILATAPGQSFSVSLFIDFFIDDFNLTRTTVSTLYGVATFAASLSLTWIGTQVDRFGNRRVGVAISALFALMLVAFSLVIHPVMLLFGFLAIRGLGQGALGLINSTVIAQWFAKRRGRMISLSLVLFALFQSIYVPALQSILESTDWRQVWVALGAGVALTVLPLTWLLMRNRPEDYGLAPDGIRLDDPLTAEQDAFAEVNWQPRQARRTAMFWVLAFTLALTPALGTGLIIHQISLFESLGYTAKDAAQTFSNFALLTAGVALIGGVLVDRLPAKAVVLLQAAALMLALFMATLMTERWMLAIYAGSFALAMGLGSVISGVVWTNVFGRRHQGAIRGLATTITVGGTAVGPIIFGISYDTAGDYGPVLWLGMGIVAVLMVLMILVPHPQPLSDESGETS